MTRRAGRAAARSTILALVATASFAAGPASAAGPTITDPAGDAGWVSDVPGGPFSDARVDLRAGDAIRDAVAGTLTFRWTVEDLGARAARKLHIATPGECASAAPGPELICADHPELWFTFDFVHGGASYSAVVEIFEYGGVYSLGPGDVMTAYGEPAALFTFWGSIGCGPCLDTSFDVGTNEVSLSVNLAQMNAALADLGRPGWGEGSVFTETRLTSHVYAGYGFAGGDTAGGLGGTTYTVG